MAIGTLPEGISLAEAIDSIGENIILADKEYNIVWMNSSAERLLSDIAPLFGISEARKLIGVNMDRFHRNPKYQRELMKHFDGGHRARINIQDRFVSDIVISSIKGRDNELQGYVVMLMDVTTKAEEEEKKEKLLYALSVPMINIWENTIALPLIGKLDKERADRVISSVLPKCVENRINFVLIDLSSLEEFENETMQELHKLSDCLRLIGTQCILVGITPKLALSAGDIDNGIRTYRTAYDGLQYIIKATSTK